MKKFKKGDLVVTKHGTGKVVYEDEDSMTVVVQYPDKSQHALPRFEVNKVKD